MSVAEKSRTYSPMIYFSLEERRKRKANGSQGLTDIGQLKRKMGNFNG